MRALTMLIVLAVAVIPVGTFVHFSWINHYLAGRQAEAYQREVQARTVRDRKDAEFRVARQKLVERARTAVPECQARGSAVPVQRCNKVLIWDGITSEQSPAQERLSEALRAGHNDREVTVFWIVDKQQRQVRSYGQGVQQIRGYQVDLEVCVVQLPENLVIGMYKVPGAPPPQAIRRNQYDFRPEIGEVDGPLARWVEDAPVSTGR